MGKVAEQVPSTEKRAVELLRFTTAGSVDDGKSTLIGRLLYDSKSILEDQMEALQRSADITGGSSVNLANLTDGLRAEREQGITIDVAYRYFATPRRKFIVADTPGHVQYTRNMVTGASTSNLAIVLIDTRHGVIQQTRRHAYIASLLGIPHLVVCVNKMDLVDYSQEVFDRIEEDFTKFSTRLDIQDITFIPVSALIGDNIVERSANMPWYEGPILLNHLEEVYISSDRNLTDPRFPVQYVIRHDGDGNNDFRGFSGQVAGGAFRVGDPIVVLPSGKRSTIKEIHTIDGPIDIAFTPMAVVLRLEDEIDISRGDTIVHPANVPFVTQSLETTLCWMDDQPLQLSRRYILKHTTRTVRAMIKQVNYKVNIDTLEHETAEAGLDLNEIGHVSIKTSAPLIFDHYRKNRQTGGFILIDEVSHQTVAAGMLNEVPRQPPIPEYEGYMI